MKAFRDFLPVHAHTTRSPHFNPTASEHSIRTTMAIVQQRQINVLSEFLLKTKSQIDHTVRLNCMQVEEKYFLDSGNRRRLSSRPTKQLSTIHLQSRIEERRKTSFFLNSTQLNRIGFRITSISEVVRHSA